MQKKRKESKEERISWACRAVSVPHDPHRSHPLVLIKIQNQALDDHLAIKLIETQNRVETKTETETSGKKNKNKEKENKRMFQIVPLIVSK